MTTLGVPLVAWGRKTLRALGVFALLATGLPGLAQAQGKTFVPPDCQTVAQTARSVLEKRRTDIEAALEKLRASLRAGPDDTASRAINLKIRRQQEDLLEVLFALDCPNTGEAAKAATKKKSVRMESMAPPPPPPPAPASRGLSPAPPQPTSASPAPRAAAAPQPDTVEVTTYYATNRKLDTAARSPGETYGREGIAELTFGRTVVSIPATHTTGNIELPTLWKFERTADPSKHFILKAVTPIETNAAKAEIADKLKAGSSRAMLIYVHGYNMGFEEAALRTAQLSYDLKFPGVAFFYSWPSANRVRAYLQDEETARLCEGVFESLIKEISALPVDAVYIVAHSMGNRIVGHGLQAYVEKGNDTKHIKELLLAAPDINADLFKTAIAPRLAQMQNTRTTIYASSWDIALMASKVVHGFRRVGESSGGVLVYKGLDTVDASEAASSTRNFGHSYLVDSASVLNDLHAVIGSSLAAKARGLTQMGTAPDLYWQLR
jgi:esterase/lipase superfamily enzyme